MAAILPSSMSSSMTDDKQPSKTEPEHCDLGMVKSGRVPPFGCQTQLKLCGISNGLMDPNNFNIPNKEKRLKKKQTTKDIDCQIHHCGMISLRKHTAVQDWILELLKGTRSHCNIRCYG